MSALVLYSLLSAAFYYLGARALITSWLWSQYPIKLAKFADCSACSGAWYGAIIAATLGRHVHIDVFELDALAWHTPIVVGLCMIVLTPIVAGLMQRGLDSLGSAIAE